MPLGENYGCSLCHAKQELLALVKITSNYCRGPIALYKLLWGQMGCDGKNAHKTTMPTHFVSEAEVGPALSACSCFSQKR